MKVKYSNGLVLTVDIAENTIKSLYPGNPIINNAIIMDIHDIKNIQHPDFVIFVAYKKNVETIFNILPSVLSKSEKTYPLCLVIPDSTINLYKPDRCCILLPADTPTYKFLLLLFMSGIDAVDNSLDALVLYIDRIIDFYKIFRKLLAFYHIHSKLNLTEASYDFLIQVSELVESFDGHPVDHVRRSGRIAFDIAKLFGIDDTEAKHIARAVKMHDVGKLFLPKEILGNNVVVQNYDEWRIFHEHTRKGSSYIRKFFKNTAGTEYEMTFHKAINVALCHHENCDGSGYPARLSGKNIPFEAKIARIIDVFDSLIRNRPYRKAYPVEEVVDVIRGEKGKTLDPEIVEAFIEIISEYYPVSYKMQRQPATLSLDHI